MELGNQTVKYTLFAFFYVDPGAGSMLLQLLLGGAAGLYALLKIFKQRILRLFGLDKGDDKA